MITKDQLLASMLRDCDVVEHLYTKLDASSADYRPSPDQRSTLELLRYLAVCAVAPLKCLTGAGWSSWAEHAGHVDGMTFEGFPEAFAQQRRGLVEWFGQVDDAQLAGAASMPWGEEIALGAAVLEAPAKWLSSYKLQLFLYAKACGAGELGTPNCWVGRDPEPA